MGSRFVKATYAVAVGIAVAAVAGCGTTTAQPLLPQTQSQNQVHTQATTDDSNSASVLSHDDAMLAFAQCMREQGVDMADPVPGEGMRLDGNLANMDAIAAAQEACHPILERARGGEGMRAREMDDEMKEKLLAVSACVRENGFPDFADPEFGTGGGVSVRGNGKASPEEMELLMAAMSSCQQQVGLDMPGGGPAPVGIGTRIQN